MINTHEQEKKQFRRLFQQQGIDQFDLRSKVLDAFLQLEHHVTVQDILAQLNHEQINVEEGFISNTMELLCRFGFASKMELESKGAYYEHRHLGLHHDHMVCTKCGAITEFRDEAIERQQLKLAEAYKFHMLQHKMEIYGICGKCMEDRDPVVTLDKAKQGEKLIIRELESGKNLHLRISSMGLKAGDAVEIVSSGFGGQVVIAAGDTRLVLGKGMAEKIKVEPYPPESVEDSQSNGVISAHDYETLLLSQMKAGQEGIIRKVTGKGTLRRRLLEMGINRGTSVYVEKYAPLKDPLELVVKGYHVSLRVEEAANIVVDSVKTVRK